jgi:hypothetical protein
MWRTVNADIGILVHERSISCSKMRSQSTVFIKYRIWEVVRQRFIAVELLQWGESLMQTFVYLYIKETFPVLQNKAKKLLFSSSIGVEKW